MKYVTTFGASKVYDEELYNEGVELGKFLASKGYIVKCGGYSGLMEAVSRGVREANGEVIGITLKPFESIRENNPYLTKKIVAQDLYERLKLLIEDSKIFVVQRGSIGTLNELFMVWALKYGLNKDINICLIGYDELKNCKLIPKERLNDLNFFKDLSEFKSKFDSLCKR